MNERCSSLDHVRREEDRPANDVPKLAHVPRPAVTQKGFRSGLGDLAAGPAELDAGFREKLVREIEDVVPFSKRRQTDDEFVQTIVHVLAEATFLDLPVQRDIGGGDDSHVHTDRPRAAERLRLPFLQRAQQLRLGRRAGC